MIKSETPISLSVWAHPWPARYELLDGIRGLAALAVVFQHTGVADVGHFAVMIFFVISGYCITASAEACRRNGGGFRDFMLKRVRRIYPPYLLAVAFFVFTRYMRSALGSPVQFKPPLIAWLQNLTLTQWVSDLFHPVHWPALTPSFVAAFWSLNYEEQFYLVTGLCLVAAIRLRIPMVTSVLVLAVIGIAWNWLIPGNFIYGLFIEYWAHFALGACLFFVLCRLTGKAPRRAFVGLLACIGIACASRVLLHAANAYVDLRAMVELSFLCGIALALYFLRPLSRGISASPLWRPVAALGTISYSLYLINQFNITLTETIAHGLLPDGSPQVFSKVTIVVLHVMLATVFWSLCERPFLRRNTESGKSIESVPENIRI